MSDRPVRVQLRRAKGWRMPPNSVKVDRTTKWGNPFVIGRDGEQDECVKLFGHLLDGLICMAASPRPDSQLAYLDMVKRDLHELRGKNLACWCKPDAVCHADALLELANASTEP